MFTRPIRRLIRSAQKLLQLLLAIPQRIASAIANWFIRRAILAKRGYRRSSHWANAGFVLPTAVLLTLVVALTVGALTFRTFSRTSDVIAERQQRVIQNAATPAIDRAKAKIEKLFEDARYPGGVPSSDVLISMMKNETANGITALSANPYIFPDETSLDENSAALTWQFTDDAGNDVIYSITIDDETADKSVSIANSDADKAANGVVRNGPISMKELRAACERSNFSREPEGGWYPINSAEVRRVFQVDAYVADENNGRVAALEFQQDRQVSRGNKWGAWFRTDLEVYPLPKFMWNGAMHTEGSIISNNNIFAHLVSSPASCVYSKDASEISAAKYEDTDESNANQAFRGEFISGVMGANSFENNTGANKFHIFHETNPDYTDANSSLDDGTDSVASGTVSDISLNPVNLYINNQSVSRSGALANADGAWKDGKLRKGRLDNSTVPIPFLDDTFRADNRFGPKPEYKDNNPDLYNLIEMGVKIGDNIPDTRDDLLTLDAGEGTEFGLDGYWERRAMKQGVRTIVGQRLELGNKFGWQGADNALTNKKGDRNGDGSITNADLPITPGYLSEPLYPATTTLSLSSTANFGSNNEDTFQQNRTLRDNLAAAQAMAVYRYDYQDGEIPLACVAVTSHNGTQAAEESSRAFKYVEIDDDDAGVIGSFLDTNFLEGKGTNGWEFPFVADTEAEFAGMIGSSDPMGRALRNLAHFAGDPKGGFPSFPAPTQSSTETYPNDYMKMWGNYSMLRQIMDNLDGSVSYSDLSPADKSTLHTAACTISMLAYNLSLQNQKIDGLDQLYEDIKSQFGGNLVQFAGEIVKLMNDAGTEFYTGSATDPSTPAGAIAALHPGNPNYVPVATSAWVDTVNNSNPNNPATYFTTCTADPAGYQPECDAGDYFKNLGRKDASGKPIPFTLAEIKAAVLTQYSAPQRPNAAQKFDLLESFVNGELVSLFQVLRDRTLGFKFGAAPLPPMYDSNLVAWDPNTGNTGDADNTNAKFALNVGCDPDIFDRFMANGDTSVNTGQGLNVAALSLTFCNSASDSFKVPKYPALYYLFPVIDHDLDGADSTGVNAFNFNHTQPATEEYIANAYVQANDDDYVYKALDPGQDGLGTNFTKFDFESGLISLIDTNGNGAFDDGDGPRALADWELPKDDSPDAAAPNIVLEEEEDASGNPIRTPLAAVPFMDHQYYDGRELMNLRTVAYDLQLLTGSGDGDFIRDDADVDEIGSVVYAFREDAVREDAILRKSSQDPAITSANGITTKPVDFVTDPGRRPYGFTLARGADLNRANGAGMTFVSDNNVLIQGDFNLHSVSGARGGMIEEFTDTLMATIDPQAASDENYSAKFYGRKALNNDFAEPTQDHWRPVEILGDAVGFVSGNYLANGAGHVDQGFVNNSGASYRGMRYPETNLPTNGWYREGGGDTTQPIAFGRNGYPISCTVAGCATTASYNTKSSFFAITRANNDKRLGQLPDPSGDVFINATVVTGIVPSQAGQPNGGLHNLPRMIEEWTGVNLHFSGAFFQLNFSTYATAPWDDDPGVGSSNFISNFYGAPNRLWGYDVGLLYAPAGPVAERFVTPSTNRSEFYRELPSSDPYIDRLRNLLAG